MTRFKISLNNIARIFKKRSLLMRLCYKRSNIGLVISQEFEWFGLWFNGVKIVHSYELSGRQVNLPLSLLDHWTTSSKKGAIWWWVIGPLCIGLIFEGVLVRNVTWWLVHNSIGLLEAIDWYIWIIALEL